MFPVAPDDVIPLGEPMLKVAPLERVNVPALVRTLVPMFNVEPLFTVKLMVLEIVPPDVKFCVPAFVNLISGTELPVSVIVPAVCEKSPLTLNVTPPVFSDMVIVPPVMTKFPARLIFGVPVLAVSVRLPPLMLKFPPIVIVGDELPTNFRALVPVLMMLRLPVMFAKPPPGLIVVVWFGQFHVKLPKVCPIPLGEVAFVVYPITSTVDEAFHVAVGIVPAVVVKLC